MKWVIRSDDVSHEVDVHQRRGRISVTIDGEAYEVDFIRLDEARASLRFPETGQSFSINFERAKRATWRIGVGVREFLLDALTPLEAISSEAVTLAGGPSTIEAPIPGKVVKVDVAPGDEVTAGQAIVILEAMKMENDLIAEQGGVVSAVHVEPGMTVETGQLLVELAATKDSEGG